jgi:transcriptional regulator with XRE-family HTH domain
MTDTPASLPLQNLSRRRLADFLQRLAQQGLTQQQVASRANLPPQYLSDLKCGRRPMTELVARRLGEEFDINHHWLLGTSNTMEPPESRSGHSAALPAGNWLPVLNIPIEGKPRANLAWDRTMVELSGAVADMLVQAQFPYALRFGHNDVEGRLRKNDLVLISQSESPDAEIFVVRSKSKLFLARRGEAAWLRVANGSVLPSNCPVVGHCVGIIWGSLCTPPKV